MLGVDAGDAVGKHGLAVGLRVGSMAPLYDRLRNHSRQVGHAADHGRIHIIEHEAEVLEEALVSQLLLGMRQVELHLVVHLALEMRAQVGVVAGAVLVDVGEEALDLAVVGLHEGAVEAVVRQAHLEIDLRKGSVLYGNFQGIVAEKLAYKHLHGRVAGLKGVLAVDVGGEAYRRAFEVDTGERNRLASVGVSHRAADFRGLGEGADGKTEKQGKYDGTFPHRNAKIAIIAIDWSVSEEFSPSRRFRTRMSRCLT